MKALAVLLLVIAAAGSALAQSEPLPAWFNRAAGPADANVNLPPHVRAEAGKLTLFADFEHPEEQSIPLYLVNRTDRAISAPGEDGDLFIKLERQLPSGEWERVQTHQYSTCGNSRMARILPPGMFCRIPGYRPTVGQSAAVRYSSHWSLEMISNAGEGVFNPADAAAARVDQMSMLNVPPGIRRFFDPESPFGSERLSEKVAALRLAEVMGESPAIRLSAQKWADELAALAKPSREQQAALRAAREILGRNWGAKQRLEPLLRRCLEAVKSSKRAVAGFGTPEKEIAFVWHVMRGIGSMETNPGDNGIQPPPKSEPALWREVMGHVAANVLTAEEDEATAMSQLLEISPLVDEFLPDEALEPLLAGNYWAATTAARALSRRGGWERLVDAGYTLKPANQIYVLSALSRGPHFDERTGTGSIGSARGNAGPPKEQAYWAHVLKTQPVSAAAVLNADLRNDYNPYRGEEFDEYKSWWKREAERSDKKGKDFELDLPATDYFAAVNFIGAWKDPENIPLLRALLRHRGYEKQMGYNIVPGSDHSKIIEVRREFPVRRAAAAALKRLGEAVPEDVVFGVEVPPSAHDEAK